MKVTVMPRDPSSPVPDENNPVLILLEAVRERGGEPVLFKLPTSCMSVYAESGELLEEWPADLSVNGVPVDETNRQVGTLYYTDTLGLLSGVEVPLHPPGYSRRAAP